MSSAVGAVLVFAFANELNHQLPERDAVDEFIHQAEFNRSCGHIAIHFANINQQVFGEGVHITWFKAASRSNIRGINIP